MLLDLSTPWISYDHVFHCHVSFWTIVGYYDSLGRNIFTHQAHISMHLQKEERSIEGIYHIRELFQITVG